MSSAVLEKPRLCAWSWIHTTPHVTASISVHARHFSNRCDVYNMVKVVQTITVTGQIHSCLHYIHIHTHNKHMFVTTKHVFCHDNYTCRSKTFVATKLCIYFVMTKLLSHQMCVCHDKSFVATTTCLSWQKFCCVMHTFVVTKDVFSHDIHVCRYKSKRVMTKLFVVTKLCLSRQNYVCRDKRFVATSILLSRKKRCFVSTNTCLFVTTKMILVAAPANDISCSHVFH